MPHYEWTGDGLFRDRRNGQELEPGDVAELPENVGEPQPELVRVKDESESDDEETAESATEEVADEAEPESESEEVAESDSAPDRDLDPHPSDLTVDQIRDRVAEIDDEDVLVAIRSAEANGQDRTTALDAIDARLDELSE